MKKFKGFGKFAFLALSVSNKGKYRKELDTQLNMIHLQAEYERIVFVENYKENELVHAIAEFVFF